MLLRNFDLANGYFDYESKTELEKDSNVKINGWYKFVNGQISALLVKENNLYFTFGENNILIESHSVLLKPRGKTETEFNLIYGSNVLVKFLYRSSHVINFSPFEYIDEDDSNWGEFVAKIINDKERQRNFVMNLMEG